MKKKVFVQARYLPNTSTSLRKGLHRRSSACAYIIQPCRSSQVSSTELLSCFTIPGKHRPSSPRKESKSPSPRRENNSRPQSPRKEPKQTRSVETETIPQSNVEASLKSDVYKLEQLVLLLR